MSDHSKPTKGVMAMESALRNAQSTLFQVHPPVARLAVIVTEIDGYIGDGIRFAGFVENLLNVLKQALQMCKYLGELIPEVGPILADAASIIEKLNIEDKVRRVVNEIRTVLERAQNGVVTKIKEATSKVCSELENAIRVVPGWIQTVGILKMIFMLIDILLPVFFESKQDMKEKFYKGLEGLSGRSAEYIKCLGAAFEQVKAFLKETWEPIREAMIEPLQTGFKEIMTALQPVFRIIQSCSDTCSKIKEWFEPFFWVLDAVQWLFEKTVGWLIDKVLNGLGLKTFIDNFMKTILEKLGITDLRDSISKLFDSIMDEVCSPLKGIADAKDLKSIAFLIKELTASIETFQKNPAGTLIDVVRIGVATYVVGPFDTLHPVSVPPRETYSFMAMALPPTLTNKVAIENNVEYAETARKKLKTADPEKDQDVDDALQSHWKTLGAKELSLVTDRQKNMDEFIQKFALTEPTNVGAKDKRPSESLSPAANSYHSQAFTNFAIKSSRTSRPVPTPMVATAIHAGCPVSILMRTLHNPIVRDQEHTRSTPLTPFQKPQILGRQDAIKAKMHLSALKGVTTSDTNANTTTTSQIPNFDIFGDKFKQLKNETDHVTGIIKKLLPIAQQADDGFAMYRPEALHFFDHFVAMLDGVDPILEATQGTLKMPLDYHQQVAGKTAELFEALGLPEGTNYIIEPIFECISKTKDAVDDFAKKKTELRSSSVDTSAVYKEWHKHVVQIYSPDRFPRSLGAGVTDLSSFLNALSRRLNSILTCFCRLYETGNAAFTVGKDQMKGTKAAEDILKCLDDAYEGLLPIIERFVNDVHDMPDYIWFLYKSLQLVHGDLVRLFDASNAIAEKCRTLELEVMAADRVRSLCDRVNASFGPLQKLFGEPEVNSKAQEHAGTQPYGDLSDFFSEVVYAGITVLLDSHFNLGQLTADVDDLRDLLQHPTEKHLEDFGGAMQKLIEFLNRNEFHFFTPNTSSSDSGSGLLIPIANPMMREETAKDFSKILHEITVLCDGVKFTTKEDVTSKTIRTPKWSQDGIDQSKIDMVAVKSWGTAWDKAEPQFPSHVFIAWYELLEGLDELMRDRAPWQRIQSQDPVPALPEPLKPGTPGGEVWSSLESRALAGASAYNDTILKSLQKPLHDRIQQLMREPFPLRPAPAADILKLLPPPQPGLAVSIQGLPREAVDIAESAFKGRPLPKGKAIPEELEVLFGQQDRFENIRLRLIPRVSAASGIGGLGCPPVDDVTKTLGGIHTDYNCMDARKLQELTADTAVTREFMRAVGIEAEQAKL